MKKQESLDEELQSLSPWLREQNRRQDGMQLPDGYFEGLEDAIFEKIDAQNARRPALSARSGGLLRRMMQPRSWAAAAAVATIAVASWWMLQPAPAVLLPAETYTEALTEEDIEEYVLDNLSEFEADQLAVVSETEQLENVPEPKSSTSATPKTTEEIPEEEIENLLQHMSEEELESLL